MLIRSQQLLFDIILFIYGLAAILFAARVVWLTKKRLNEAFQFILMSVIVWSIVKLIAILSDLKLLSVYAVSLGELFFISLLIISTWYMKQILLDPKTKKKKKRSRRTVN